MAELTGPVLFLVPARGGSVRIPGKNLRTVAGIPLVGHAVRNAVAAAALVPGGPHLVLCSTDDPAIAAVARSWGAETIDRPPALADAAATSVDVALHALDARPASVAGGPPWEAVVLVQPTSPLTDPGDLVAAVEQFRTSGGRSVASVTASHPASWHVVRDGDPERRGASVRGGAPAGRGGPVRPLDGDDAAAATEVLSGAIYVVAPGELRATRRFVGPGTIGLAIPPERSVDIDHPHDLLVAEALAAARPPVGAPSPTSDVPPPPVAAPPPSTDAPRSEARPPRTIAVLTTGRQDWGILHSTATAIRDHPQLRLRLLVGGMHLSARHGSTIEDVRADGFEPDARLDWLGSGAADGHGDGNGAARGEDEPPADAQAGEAVAAIGAELRANPVDAIVLAGDRFETAAAALAATIDTVPIIHLHGGEQTFGAFDDALRHAITKLAHLHLVSHEEHAARVIAMGEAPATVHVVGLPGLDAIARPDLPDRAALEATLGIDLRPPVVLVTVHPATLDADSASAARAVAAAMDRVPATYVVTLPNVDPGAAEVLAVMTAAGARPGRVAVAALGERRYWGLLRIADAMLGNSSSGIAEAPQVGLPVVNVGDRQAGRRRSGLVVDVPADADQVAAALAEVLVAGRPETVPGERSTVDGRAGERVADIIAAWQPSVPPRKAPIRIPS